MNFIFGIILAMLFFMVGKFVGGDSFFSGWIVCALYFATRGMLDYAGSKK